MKQEEKVGLVEGRMKELVAELGAMHMSLANQVAVNLHGLVG